MASRLPSLGCLARILSRQVKWRHTLRPTIGVNHLHVSQELLGTDPTVLRMPAYSAQMTKGGIVEWLKKEGDPVLPGDVLCKIKSDKSDIDHEIEEEGILAKILIPENTENIPVGTPIALMVDEGERWQDIKAEQYAPDALPPHDSQPSHISYVLGPAVKSLLELYALYPTDVSATGPRGILVKGDILNFVKTKNLKRVPPQQIDLPPRLEVSAPEAVEPPTPAAATTVTPSVTPAQPPEGQTHLDIELTNMRKTIAKRLTESKTTVPHAYSTIQCGMDNLLQLRKEFADMGTKVSPNDFIIKAVAVALKRVPGVNAMWSGTEVKLQDSVDISVAVATPNGLITPIVTDAVNLGLAEISTTVKELAGKAREGKLKPHEFMGGTFTISNLGMFGITEFSAIINPPQACILAVGSSRLVPGPEGTPQSLMTVTLCHDARVVDEFLAAQFLETFREVLESPVFMIAQQPAVTESPHIDKNKLFAK